MGHVMRQLPQGHKICTTSYVFLLNNASTGVEREDTIAIASAEMIAHGLSRTEALDGLQGGIDAYHMQRECSTRHHSIPEKVLLDLESAARHAHRAVVSAKYPHPSLRDDGILRVLDNDITPKSADDTLLPSDDRLV